MWKLWKLWKLHFWWSLTKILILSTTGLALITGCFVRIGAPSKDSGRINISFQQLALLTSKYFHSCLCYFLLFRLLHHRLHHRALNSIDQLNCFKNECPLTHRMCIRVDLVSHFIMGKKRLKKVEVFFWGFKKRTCFIFL